MEHQCGDSTSTPDIKINMDYVSLLPMDGRLHETGRWRLFNSLRGGGGYTTHEMLKEVLLLAGSIRVACNTVRTDSEREAGQRDPFICASNT